MTLPAIAAAALLGGLFRPAYQPVTIKTYGEGGWILKITTDNFTRQTTCTIVMRRQRHPDVTLEHNLLSFHFSPRIDTSDAWYSVDDGAPRAWRDLNTQLVRTGAVARAEQLDNETGGVVLIPLADVKGAAVVDIQPERHATPRRVQIKDLWPITAAAQRLGCGFSGVGESPRQLTPAGAPR